MLKTRFQTLWLSRLARGAGTAVVVVSIGVVIFLGRDWFAAFGAGKLLLRHALATALTMLLALYPVISAVAVVGLLISLWAAARARSRADFLSRSLQVESAARWSLLCGTTVLAIGVAEVIAGQWLAWSHRLPALPKSFARSTPQHEDVRIIVIGESSALGVPYDDWLSVGEIVGRELERAIPSMRFSVEILAEKGATLETMHLKLAQLAHRPDVLIIYCGHNEFLARFSPSTRVLYYEDERSLSWGRGALEWLAGNSAVARLARENLEKQRVALVPTRSFGVLESTIGRPVCTSQDAERVLEDFERRLEAIVADCERIGCLPILIIPPGNDASDPSQSYALRQMTAKTRHDLFERLTRIRSFEKQDQHRAAGGYREFISLVPVHAQACHRLARLLEAEGSFSEADRLYTQARDHDGLPLRADTRLESAYRRVAQRHAQCSLLVDGPAVLKAQSRHGILDNQLFHDNVHPTLKAHAALAEAVLEGLRTRHAFGWPAEAAAIKLKPTQVAVDFHVDRAAWAEVCRRTAAHYDRLAFFTVDSEERIQWRDRYSQAARMIESGATAEDTGIPGVGMQEHASARMDLGAGK